MYYAIVKPNINFSEIVYEIDQEEKIVTAVLPQKFSFDVELLEDFEQRSVI